MKQSMSNISLHIIQLSKSRAILTYSSVVKYLEQDWRHGRTIVHGNLKRQILYENG